MKLTGKKRSFRDNIAGSSDDKVGCCICNPISRMLVLRGCS
jgi:hypothetical protein